MTTELATGLADLTKSLASIKENVTELATEFTRKTADGEKISADLTDKTDKALSELGAVSTRISDLEKRAAREKEEGVEEQKSLGQLVVETAGFKNGALSGTERGSIRVIADRAAITTADTTQGAGRSVGTSLVQGARVPGIFALTQRQLTIRDLLMPGRTGSNNIEYVKQTGFTNNAAPVAETTAKPYSDIAFNMMSAPVRTLAHLFKASRQIMDDAPALASFIDGQARYGLKLVEENQLLNGSGTGQNIAGILPQATAFAPSFTPTSATAIDRLRLAVLQVVLAQFPATAFVLNPIDWAKIELTKDAGGNYIVGQPQGALSPTLWNLPVVSSFAMASGTFLTGAFNIAAQIFDRMDIEVLLSSENVDDFEKNMLSVRCEERLALAVYRPEAFVTGAVNPA
ncbi:capsid protein [Rhizobium sp. Leaf384]|uniref:phage major capsid protein n=1 Tax=unclassified Rhizobium TaxID=2613769 RepID=UPI0007137177|nr:MULTISPECIES: phage major capsid protein [unclassified Rhizobium]KQS74224.1 capsid protein [Rhizobium sp. Leaf383]KQS80419.1 capsid protein [Rhizobium sp. Leaf384]